MTCDFMNEFQPNRCFRCRQELHYISNDNNLIEKFLKEYAEDLPPLKVIERLKDILGNYSDLSNLLCHSCSNIYYEKLNKDLKNIQEEITWYEDILKAYRTYGEDISEDTNHNSTSNIEHYDEELEKLKLQCATKDKEYEEEIKISNDLDVLEKNLFKSRMMDEEDFKLGLNNQLEYVENEIKKWSNTDPISFVFQIKFDGCFGIINNCRLGRIPNIPDGNVSWNEINAAWGETLHLLQSLSNRLNFSFKGFFLQPRGPRSFLKSFDEISNTKLKPTDSSKCTTQGTLEPSTSIQNYNSKTLPLYYSGSGLKFFWDTKFDQAMVAFLECVKQISEELEHRDHQFKLPYRIEKGRLFEPSSTLSFSIKAQFNSEENWTKALKYTLTNVQWIQSCVTSLI